MSLTILFLAANPTDTARLRVDQECRLIGKALRSAGYRDQFNLENHGAVHVEDLQELFLLHRPQIVHFSGHGSSGGEIVLEDKNGNSQAVPVDALSRLFAILKGNIGCVVLNACATEAQAQAIAQHIDCVIGMSQAISDDASIVFATAFYQALGYGESVQKAFELGCNEIDLNHLGEQNTPRLIALNADPARIILTDQPQPPNALPPIDIIDLPTRPETFQGRLTEIQTLARYLSGDARPRLITLYGAPGLGKTTLARQAVERFAPSWPGGILAISFENLPTRQDLVARLAEFLNIDATQLPPDQAERRVLQTLARRPATLLVLDNAETLVDQLDANVPAAALAEFLQDRIPPTVTLFVTSRRRLGLPGEQTLELPGLTPPEGAQLFQQSAPDQPATPADLARLEALSAQLEGHPLSLRLLGIAYNNFGPNLSAFLHQFEHHLTLADDKYKSLENRQRTLFACIATSIHPLDPELKTLFFNLALFHAPFRPINAAAIFAPDAQNSSTLSRSLNALLGKLSFFRSFFKASVAADSKTKTSPVPKQLWQLWQRGLLERQLHPTGSTQLELYHLLPPLRLYAEQTAPLSPEIFPRFAQIYGELISWIWDELGKGPTASLLARLSAPDLERALEHTQDLARASYNRYLGYVEFRLGHPWKGKPRLEQALAWARDHDQQLVSNALNELGLICDSTGQPQEALKYYREALPIFQKVGDQAGQATTLNNIGMVYATIGQPQEALKYYREALPIFKEVGDRAGKSTTLNNIAAVYGDIGRPQEALKYYREALPIYKEVGDRAGEAATLNNIGVVYGAIGQPQEALKYYCEMLPIYKEVGDRAGQAVTLNNIGLVYRGIGQPQEALKYYREALPIHKEVGNRAGQAVTLTNIGLVYRDIGQMQEALKYYCEALPIRQEVGDRAGEAITLTNIGVVYRAIGQPQEALKYCREALPIHREVGGRAGEASTLYNIGMVYDAIGQPQEALKYYREALPIRQEVGDRNGEASTLNNIGAVYNTIGQPQEALKYYHEALPIYQEVGNRAGEAATLNNIGAVYNTIGQPQEALKYYHEALPIYQEVGNRAGEAATLNNIGAVYNTIGQPQEALKYYREALPIRREVGDRAGEAGTLNNIGMVYRTIGQPQEALKYYREALPISQEVGDRVGEATTLNGIGMVYDNIGQPQETLKYYREALPIFKEVGDRAREAVTLNNIGGVYHDIGQPQEALKYYREALPIRREVGDRAGEATTLHNMAWLLVNEGETQKALDLFWQSLSVHQEIGAVASEATTLYALAFLLGNRLNDPAQALPLLRRSIDLLKTNGLPQDAAGTTLAQHEALLAQLEAQV